MRYASLSVTTARLRAAFSEQSWRGWGLRFGVLALAYFSAAYFSLLFAMVDGAGPPFWPAGGIGLAGLLIGGLNLWPAIMAGRILAGFATGSGQPFIAEIGLGLAQAGSAWVAIYMFRYRAKFEHDLASVASIIRFSIYGAGLYALLVTFFGVAILTVSSGLSMQETAEVFLMGFFSAGGGALVVCPLILNWWYGPKLKRPVYFWLLMSLVLACSTLVLASPVESTLRAWHVLPLLLWAALVFRVRGATTAIAIVATMALMGAIFNVPFTEANGGSILGRISLMQQFTVVVAVTFLFVAALQTDRERDSERFLRRVLDNILAFVVVLKPDGSLVEANLGTLAMIGLDLSDVVGKPFDQCFWGEGDESLQSHVRDAIKRTSAGEAQRFDVSIKGLNGAAPLWIDFQLSPLRDSSGTITHLIASGVDLTSRRQAEGKALELAEIIEKMPDLVATADLNGNLTFMNAGGWDMIGSAPKADSSTVGLHMTDIISSQRTTEVMQQAVPTTLAEGTWRGESALKTKNGLEVPVNQVILLHRDETGKPSRISTIARDITRDKADAEHRALLMRELLHRVRNTLAIIQSIARQTARSTPDPKQFSEVFIGRVDAMAAAHTLLTDTNWHAPDIRAVIKSQLGGFNAGSAQSLTLSGPHINLPPEVSTKFGLVLHELGTNAQKYGAWSRDGGRLDMNWKLDGQTVKVTWNETFAEGHIIETHDDKTQNGQTRRGFGSTLIERSVLDYEKTMRPGGLEITFSISMHE
jgi:PAS domain S-box-containing protein